jgi:hypothetical protein
VKILFTAACVLCRRRANYWHVDGPYRKHYKCEAGCEYQITRRAEQSLLNATPGAVNFGLMIGWARCSDQNRILCIEEVPATAQNSGFRRLSYKLRSELPEIGGHKLFPRNLNAALAL